MITVEQYDSLVIKEDSTASLLERVALGLFLEKTEASTKPGEKVFFFTDKGWALHQEWIKWCNIKSEGD